MNTIFSCTDINVLCYKPLHSWLGDLYMTLLSNILSNAVGLNYIQTQDCKTFLETLYSPNVTLWGKKLLNIYSTLLFKVMMNHSCIKDQKFSTVRKNSTALSKWSAINNKSTLCLSGLFRNLDFISCLGRRITTQPHSLNTATCHYITH